MITAVFSSESRYAKTDDAWQWDYGQVLRIQGLKLPSIVQIHFSLQETGGVAITRLGTTKDGVTDVTIPDSMLENSGIIDDYYIYAFIYLTDSASGQTTNEIKIHVKARSEPEVPGGGEDPDIFHDAVQAVQKSADKAAESERQAEGWAHGREDLPERAQDNAKYYAGQAADTAAKIPGRVEEAKEEIDRYVQGKEEQLKGETGNVYFAAFKVVNGRLKMYSDPEIDKVRFIRIGSRLLYRLNF